MVRGEPGAAIFITAIVISALCCMRGGRAFATGCARGGCGGNHNRFAFPPSPSRSSLNIIGANSHGHTSRRARSIHWRLPAVTPEAPRRRTQCSTFVMMSSSSASSAPFSTAASAGPVKRHCNSFLLPLQHQQQQQRHQQHQQQQQRQSRGEEATTPTAGTLTGEGEHAREGGDSAVNVGSSSSSSRSSGDDQAAAAAVVAAAAAGRGRNDPDHDEQLALVILNARGDDEGKSLLRHLWSKATLRVCADGGANRLHDSFDVGGEHTEEGGDTPVGDPSEDRARFVPDVIVGDLDSLRPEVARYYEERGSEIKRRDDQDHCDFEKCLVEVESRLSPSDAAAQVETAAAASSAVVDDGCGDGAESRATNNAAAAARAGSPRCTATVVGLGAFGGRFDHEMQAVSLLHAYTSRFDRLVLMGAGNVAFLLEPGRSHTVEPDLRFEGPTVGLIPVGGPCRTVTTEGLQWNLDGRGLEFGVCVSSSNKVVGDVVQVTTDAPLVWTAEFKAAAWIEVVSSGERSC